jgi:hypothetical protein
MDQLISSLFPLLKLEVVESSTPESWSIEQVAQWLSSINLKELVENFRRKFSSSFSYNS